MRFPAAGSVTLAPGVYIDGGMLTFSFSGSSGPGGQNVNKKATKAELRVPIYFLPIPEDARQRLGVLAGGRLTASGELVIASDEYRSQNRNKAACLARLRKLVVRALVTPRPRKPTKPRR